MAPEALKVLKKGLKILKKSISAIKAKLEAQLAERRSMLRMGTPRCQGTTLPNTRLWYPRVQITPQPSQTLVHPQGPVTQTCIHPDLHFHPDLHLHLDILFTSFPCLIFVPNPSLSLTLVIPVHRPCTYFTISRVC